jgi:tellurite resistance protein TerC
VIHALHTNELPFVNGGEHVTAIPEIPISVSLAVILGTLLVTTVASLAKSRRDRIADTDELVEEPALSNASI